MLNMFIYLIAVYENRIKLKTVLIFCKKQYRKQYKHTLNWIGEIERGSKIIIFNYFSIFEYLATS